MYIFSGLLALARTHVALNRRIVCGSLVLYRDALSWFFSGTQEYPQTRDALVPST